MDGYEFIRKLRTLRPAAGGSTPAVALSALASREDRERALAAGFEVHIAKPVGMRELARTLGELVATSIEAQTALGEQ